MSLEALRQVVQRKESFGEAPRSPTPGAFPPSTRSRVSSLDFEMLDGWSLRKG